MYFIYLFIYLFIYFQLLIIVKYTDMNMGHGHENNFWCKGFGYIFFFWKGLFPSETCVDETWKIYLFQLP